MKFSRLGLIGDVHAEAQRLQAALHFLREAGVEKILCVGDICDGNGNVDECCELLQQQDVAMVRGNHDRWLLTNQMRDLPDATQWETISEWSQSFIRALPKTRSFETIAGPLLLCHGLGENDMQRLTPDDYGYALEVNDELHQLIRQREFRFVVGGHTHRRMVRPFKNLTVINVGTLHGSHQPCLAIADFQERTVRFHDITGSSIETIGSLIKFSSS